MRHSSFYQFLMVIWPLAVSVKCFDSFLLFKNYRGLYVLIKESLNDSINFTVVMMYICFVFALIIQLNKMGVIYDFQ